ncbi:GIY-YIG nuclease family protein [Mesorhizobium sp. ESP6-5]|uniref:GIY-YIG nuclease family protein n=1 Tax=Mesorhizobium sp. ESP6-5 TaxID=2876623 RepID=UPI001CD005E3|nr:GIY-YIG nuclease family protein [Mesorhizobium sp. ESP6-5]
MRRPSTTRAPELRHPRAKQERSSVAKTLGRRMPEHKSGQGSRFTSQYGVQRLVWYEEYFDITDAIQREKSLKRRPRLWKVELIEKANPDWFELFRGTGW